MAERSLLSVVMPTRNRVAEALRAARSVLSQDVDLELVVIDDSSDDTTAYELERLAARDRRVRVVSTAPHGPLGPCLARNLGLELSSGELVSFCDDDDRWCPGAARVMLEFLEANRHLVMASSWHLVRHVESGTAAVYRGPTTYDHQLLLWQNFVALPFGVIRRAALPFEIRFDPDLPTGEDWDLWLRCAEHGPVGSVAQVCYVYTQHSRGRVTRAVQRQIDGRLGFLAKHGDAMTPACRLYHQAVVAGYRGGRSASASLAAHTARDEPAAAAAVAALLATSAAASRVGVRRRDPGLQARLMARMVRRSASGR